MDSAAIDFEPLIRRDPARRGLISSEAERGPLFSGHLAASANDLARSGSSVAIVTGFFIPHATPPAAETDGPPGAALLAAALQALGMEAMLITDEPCGSAVRAAVESMGLSPEIVAIAPIDPGGRWCESFGQSERARRLTHLISIERIGPSHTWESCESQSRSGLGPLKQEFDALVPEASRDRCHNMRGRVLDEWTAPLHRLFECVPRLHPGCRTIGIGDGGNEIGMGVAPWEELAGRLAGEQAGRVPCRIATDRTILAGVSNWGAMALAAAVVAIRQRIDVLSPWTESQQFAALEHVVRRGPAVDGITGRAEPTVDGLPFLTYIQPWIAIRQRLGLDSPAARGGA